MSSRKKVVAANWKMNGSNTEINNLLNSFLELCKSSESLDNIETIICAPYIYLILVKDLIKQTNIKLGAQNTYFEISGAFTGEISPAMLQDIGCSHVIIGHSERRQLFNESDELIVKKVKSVLAQGLTPIVCVGETLEERESGKTLDVIEKQVNAFLSLVTDSKLPSLIVAYEPVWAIGTGLTASPSQAEEVHLYIRGLISEKSPESAESVRILYGGSVNPNNSKELFAMPNIDGGLIGGASLVAEKLHKICLSAAL